MNDIAIRKRALRGDKLIGSFLNTGSPILAEVAGRSGLDWCQLDMEHGSGSWEMLANQLMALEGTGAAPIVRLPGLDPVCFKRALDLGAHGVMIPNLNTADEARKAVSYSRFPPHGVRGVASMNRGAHYGAKFAERLETGHENTFVVVQIESPTAVENVDEIAAVDGVDALFVGPMDLSVSMGIPREFTHPYFLDATRKVVDAANRHNKASGILAFGAAEIAATYARGFTLVAVGSDGGMVANGMAELVSENRKAISN
ncbi:MAG: aldolase/citrate lyase family protein [Opitutaceae bacterium]|nr:aldolase/citrate lyase family protein [Opitutaceae bacterium]